MKLHVQITDDDIANGVRDSPCSCPVALAIARAAGIGPADRWGNIDVDGEGLNFRYAGKRLYSTRDLPARISRFVEAFDAGERPEPFGFTMTINAIP